MGRASKEIAERVKVIDLRTQGMAHRTEGQLLTLNEKLNRVSAELARISAGVSVVGAVSEIGATAAKRAAEQTEQDPILEAVSIAIAEEVVISFPYIDSQGETSTRVISPYEVAFTAKGARVVGYDHVRGGIRQFNPTVGIRAVPAIEPRYEFRPPVEQNDGEAH